MLKQEGERTVSDDEYAILQLQLTYMESYLSYLQQRCAMHDVEI